MSALETLLHSLKTTNDRAFQGLKLEHASLDKELKALRSWLGNNGSADPPKDLIREALGRFVRTQTTENLRDTRLICGGCIEAFGANHYRLIEDSSRFPKLLECTDRYKDEPRLFRRCYKGLLKGYFGYDPEAERIPQPGKHNWSTLRSYLHDRLANLDAPGIRPEWVANLVEHNNLLSTDPCGRYGLALLNGEQEEFAAVQRAVEIADSSWVSARMIQAQVDAAICQSDVLYKKYIPPVLDLLERHRLFLNPCLAKVLDRYHRCDNPNVHPELRSFSVAAWGNPWLTLNNASWSLVPSATRSMVADWLKLELIYKFFNLLAEDGASDSKRLRFWQRYHKHIDDMYFALGPRAANSTSRDFLDMRKQMNGRVLGLTAPGRAENNAFIMCIRDFVIVEFGVKGNACYVFRRDSLPFTLKEDGHVAGDSTELKHPDHVHWLRHADKLHKNWENIFANTLGRTLGVQPAHDDELPAGVGVPSTRAPVRPEFVAAPVRLQRILGANPHHDQSPPSNVLSAQDSGPAVSGYSGRQQTVGATRATDDAPLDIPVFGETPRFPFTYSRSELARFCLHWKFRIRDLTKIGGNLWVDADESSQSVNRQLDAWGFRYKPGKGWWRKRAD